MLMPSLPLPGRGHSSHPPRSPTSPAQAKKSSKSKKKQSQAQAVETQQQQQTGQAQAAGDGEGGKKRGVPPAPVVAVYNAAKKAKTLASMPAFATKEVYSSLFTSSEAAPQKETFLCRNTGAHSRGN